MDMPSRDVSSRPFRAFRQFRAALQALFRAQTLPAGHPSADYFAEAAAAAGQVGDIWDAIRLDCEQGLGGICSRQGTLAQAVEWEVLKLQSRLWPDVAELSRPQVPLFRNRRVHIGQLLYEWRHLALEIEDGLAARGHDTLFDVGPWGGFNFVVEEDGYTRMPFARLTLVVGSLPSTPLENGGGPFYECFLPRYRAALAAEGVTIPDEWQFQYPKQDRSGRLLEISCTYYFPHHTYERRSFVKVRMSRAYETVEEITLQDFLPILERLVFTSDWTLYREQNLPIDARFDLQDFVSLNHLVEGVYHRTAEEERLLCEIKEAFRGAIREPAMTYRYVEGIVRSKWAENLYWAIAQVALDVRKYQRPVSFSREVCPQIPPRLLIPVRNHLRAYHRRISSYSPSLPG